MTSAVVNYRDSVIASLQTNVPELLQVDWYDAIFDEADIEAWSNLNPAAMVAVRDVPMLPHSTGEQNASLDMIVSVIVADQSAPRDADATLWAIMEKVADIVFYNRFGDLNAAVPNNMRMARLREPELRRMGVALGVVEWTAGLTFGGNRAIADWYYSDPATGQLITQMPPNVHINAAIGPPPQAPERSDIAPDLQFFTQI